MESLHPGELSPGDKKRLAYIEGREDLFDTKLLDLNPEHSGGILFVARDPGGAAALIPVVNVLRRDGMGLKALVDNRAEELVEAAVPSRDITPDQGAIGTNLDALNCQAIMVATSTSELGLQTYAAANKEERPLIVLEEYYTTSFPFIRRLAESNLPMPDRLCVMDEAAQTLIVERYPELTERITVTGQPAFDRFAAEDTEAVAHALRAELGVSLEERIVTYVGTLEGISAVERVAQELRKLGTSYRFVFRVHPRDPVSYEEYRHVFAKSGIECLDTQAFDMNRVGAASDLVITETSTEALHAIYRRKPTIHITDPTWARPRALAKPVPVQLGASMGVDDIAHLGGTVQDLLTPTSSRYRELTARMRSAYRLDGKSAERVASVLRGAVASGSNASS